MFIMITKNLVFVQDEFGGGGGMAPPGYAHATGVISPRT